jgi:chaperone modulatory protein CbpM
MKAFTIRARSLRVVHRRTRVDQRPVDLGTLAGEAGLEPELVSAYVAHGLVEPSGGPPDAPLFDSGAASRLACAARLQHDLGLNAEGAVLACELLERIEELEERLARYEPGR